LAARESGAAKYRAVVHEFALVRLAEKVRDGGKSATAKTNKIVDRILISIHFDRQRHRAHVLDLLRTEKSPSGSWR
jgi:hypothetical protein